VKNRAEILSVPTNESNAIQFYYYKNVVVLVLLPIGIGTDRKSQSWRERHAREHNKYNN